MIALVAPSVYKATRQLLRLPKALRRDVVREMSEEDRAVASLAIQYDWDLWRRPKQELPENGPRWTLFACGRGWGKTRLAMELLREAAESGEHEHVAVIGATYLTLQRDLIHGPSGILAISPPWFRPVYLFTRSELRWPRHPVTGARMRAILLSGDKADRIRGAEVSLAICDEMATWAQAEEAWMNVDLILRRGPRPRGVITTTLKRKGGGSSFSRDLLFGKRGANGKRKQRPDMVVIQGSTDENVDLDRRVRAEFHARFDGTADAISELGGGLPEEAEGALWTRETIDHFRVDLIPAGVVIERVIVSVDPSRSKVGAGDLCGIITLGLGSDGHAYLYADDSVRAAPDVWVQRAISVAERQRADAVIYEQNRLGEDMVALIRERVRGHHQRWEPVTARGEKRERAEPISALYKAGRVHHVGELTELEEEMCGWDPTEKQTSPDRLDALVHGVKELLLSEQATRGPLVAR